VNYIKSWNEILSI